MRQSERGRVDPFIVMDVMEAARRAEAAGRHVIHMEVGQPATPAPLGARQALIRAMEAGPLGYTVALGLPELRARIARLYADWYGVDLNPDRVVVTAGASGAFVLAFSALFDAGERVGLGLPGYPSYRHILKAMSLTPVGIETAPQHRFQPVPEDLPPDLAGLILASPGNPNGTMLDRAQMAALAEAAAARGAALISDEIYHGIDYDRRPVSALEITDDAYVVNSFSKYFSMTGWRVGWLVVPEAHVRTVERLAQNMFICPPHASQVAALAAMDCDDELQANLAVYAENRRLMLEGLPGAGFPTFAPPDGAFYVYADVSHLTDDSLDLSRRILDGAGVAATPGLDFDPGRGHRTLRFSYARSRADIAEGLRRLGAFTAAL
ncbi:aminotransferase class I/II-fold pyridoxal phosphate-dependent enzyme [Rhodobacteraceae bacterium CCMM004]|nr:aminotransferase class I/II-fold pyridoxal phosphate-dependent enzyme [Rhodobacteraceae bacterium CCMM004]